VSKKVLVADDEAHIRHVLSLKLQNAGYEVVTATDGEEALEVCLSDLPDLVCTDFQMPYLSGLELCRRLRENEHTRQVPVLLLTARGFDIASHQMTSLGVAEVLSKPFSPRELLAKVQELIGLPGVGSTGDPA
jgi:two-component system alkaline phosphatase synthesis response regulator PhoP